ncbi:MAG: TIGR04255 family protein [Caldilinea sp.]|uniref:TIGR04255 family protein n=1 Tax=Caldilinea sp. TaxID=2293560 RepID=UPI002C1EE350|nr:TIGR04255 family protein [Anaerolineales bacterium]HQY92888.1 TIGR04255 family protein [Caldilinea sp.]
MGLNFPHHPDIALAKPPLAEVICQVRFPPILRIAREEPSEFQERIRERFPLLDIEQGVVVKLPAPASGIAPSAEIPPRVFRFTSADHQTSVSLAIDFYALSTQRYTHWSDFAANLALVQTAVESIYRPAYASRIGLRYINRFTTQGTQCATMSEVLALLRPELTALFQTDAWSQPASLVTQLNLPDDQAMLTLRTAYSESADEPFFLLDFDYYEEGSLGFDKLVERCDRYHRVIYNAFRWSLREPSLIRFGPAV